MKHAADRLQHRTAASSSRSRAVAASCVWSPTDSDASSHLSTQCEPHPGLSSAEMKGMSVLAGGMDGDAAGHHPVHGIGCSGRSDVSVVPVDWPGAGDLRFHIRKTLADRRRRGSSGGGVFLRRLLLLVNLIETADITAAASLWLQLLATYFWVAIESNGYTQLTQLQLHYNIDVSVRFIACIRVVKNPHRIITTHLKDDEDVVCWSFHLKMSSDSVQIWPLLLLLLLLQGSGSCFLCFFRVPFWDFWKQLHLPQVKGTASGYLDPKMDRKDFLLKVARLGDRHSLHLERQWLSYLVSQSQWDFDCHIAKWWNTFVFLVRLHLAQVTSFGCCWTVTRQQPLTGRLFHLTKSTYRHSVKFNLCGFYCWCNSSKGKMMALISLNCWHMDSDDEKWTH